MCILTAVKWNQTGNKTFHGLWAKAKGKEHTIENVKLMQVSLHPAATLHISSETMDSPKAQESAQSTKPDAKKEEETINELVDLLHDVVKKIPTKQTNVLQSMKMPTIIVPQARPSPSETVDTVWVNLKPKTSGVELGSSQTATLPRTTPTTAFWKLRHDANASIILHSETTSAEKATPEKLKSEATASDLQSGVTRPEDTLVSVSLLMDNDVTTTKAKSFDELTNGAFASLVESLKNVKKLHMTLHKVGSEPPGAHSDKKLAEAQQHKTVGSDILELIDTLITTIKNAPTAVREDPALHKYVEKAEGFLKNALELTAEAESKLMPEKKREQENKVNPKIPPSPPPTSPVPKATPMSSQPLAKKAEEAQVEMGKLKAFINLLYGFSPHLTAYAQTSPNKKVAEDIVDRAMAVLDAIKSIFCGKPKGRSKQMLKQLLKEDMELVRQATHGKRVF
ncbi:uncharacterized protein LOC123030704 isoform X2 [Varanus komodoensis]|uniref:uncharacterized protein LOC123030704 isoform X2 n=1 Tax=Varanus komodoensis TaxID=61221 RepID=UPI001CF7D117|nr:uncharacterized protein LOC123030704 isoform X2 [Varanus komodoensis]